MANVASDLAGMVSDTSPVNRGDKSTPGTGVIKQGGVKRAPQAPQTPMPGQTPQTRQTRPPQLVRHPPPAPQQHPRAYSSQNPPMGTAPPPIPHPGVKPPYPDARSPQPMILPNGAPVFPAPPNVMGAGMRPMGPRVPPTFTPGMTGLLGR